MSKSNSKSDGKKARARDVWLAGLGALSVMEEEGTRVFKNLVEKGVAFEKERKERAGDLMDEISESYSKAGEQVQKRFGKTGKTVEEKIRASLSKMGIPTRSDIHELGQRVDRLAVKLESLIQNKSKKSNDTNKKKTTQKQSGGPGTKKRSSGRKKR